MAPVIRHQEAQVAARILPSSRPRRRRRRVPIVLFPAIFLFHPLIPQWLWRFLRDSWRENTVHSTGRRRSQKDQGQRAPPASLSAATHATASCRFISTPPDHHARVLMTRLPGGAAAAQHGDESLQERHVRRLRNVSRIQEGGVWRAMCDVVCGATV
jgi:hypothetical protein